MSCAPEVDQGHSQTPNPMRAQQTMRIAATPHSCLCRHEEKAEAEASALINEAVQHLQQAGLRKGERGTLADDDVIQYPHIDERECGLQLLGQHAIRA